MDVGTIVLLVLAMFCLIGLALCYAYYAETKRKQMYDHKIAMTELQHKIRQDEVQVWRELKKENPNMPCPPPDFSGWGRRPVKDGYYRTSYTYSETPVPPDKKEVKNG